MKVKNLEHSALKIQANGKHLIIDPFISVNPKASNIQLDKLNPDYITLTQPLHDQASGLKELVNRTLAATIYNHEIVTYHNTHKKMKVIL